MIWGLGLGPDGTRDKSNAHLKLESTQSIRRQNGAARSVHFQGRSSCKGSYQSCKLRRDASCREGSKSQRQSFGSGKLAR